MAEAAAEEAAAEAEAEAEAEVEAVAEVAVEAEVAVAAGRVDRDRARHLRVDRAVVRVDLAVLNVYV